MKIRYIVTYHPRPVRKVADVLIIFGGVLLLLDYLIWTPFSALPLEIQALAIFDIIPNLFFHISNVSLLILAVGGGLWLFRWRPGKLELTDGQLIIEGSYRVSIGLQNLWEVDFADMKYKRWRIRVDSNVEAVEIRFKTEKEFKDICEKLLRFVEHNERIKFSTLT